MDHILLVMRRTAQQERDLNRLLEQQQDPASPEFHHWLTPGEFGQRFGASPLNLSAVADWLQGQGFRVENVPAGRNIIEFSGDAAAVRGAFHTEIHRYVVDGKPHWANAQAPQLPADMARLISGFVALNNFESHPQVRVSGTAPQANLGNGTHGLTPADYAVIYNANPLLNAGINGTGSSIAVLGRSNINLQDVLDFRQIFNLPAKSPLVIVNGTDPGDLGGDEEIEALLDTSWSGAVAPGANINLIVSATTNSTDGIFLSEMYAIDNSVGDIITQSFGTCEADSTLATAQWIASMAQQAAAEGKSFMVSTGDSGVAGCDSPDEKSETAGLSVNVLASSPYTTAVGGTEFNEGGSSAFWSSSNGAGYVSATSHIPEKVWNESCAASATCTSPNLYAGGGGVSQFFQKPGWQAGVAGVPFDGWRDIPDVSLTAAAGHDPYLLCVEGSCEYGSVYLVGGTSAAAPSFAGILALVDQKMGMRQGNANPVLYNLAYQENYPACNGSNASVLPASNCVFDDVTVGNNTVPGEGYYNSPKGKYQAGVAYDLASGLGSVNIANLVDSWSAGVSSGPPVFYYGIIGEGSGKSIDVSGASTASGAAIVQKTWTQSLDEQWQLVPAAGGYYEIVNRLSGMALTDPGNSTVDAAHMLQMPLSGAAGQLWQFAPLTSPYYKIVSQVSGYVLNVYSAGNNDGLAIIQYNWNNASNEYWQLIPVQ